MFVRPRDIAFVSGESNPTSSSNASLPRAFTNKGTSSSAASSAQRSSEILCSASQGNLLFLIAVLAASTVSDTEPPCGLIASHSCLSSFSNSLDIRVFCSSSVSSGFLAHPMPSPSGFVALPFSSINPRLRASLKTGAGSPSSIMLPSLDFTIESRQSLPASSMSFFLFPTHHKISKPSSPPSSLSVSFCITSSTRCNCAGSVRSRGMTPTSLANSLFIPSIEPAFSAALNRPTTPAMRSLLKIPRFSLPNFSISVGKTSSHTESMSSSSVVGVVGGTSVVSGEVSATESLLKSSNLSSLIRLLALFLATNKAYSLDSMPSVCSLAGMGSVSDCSNSSAVYLSSFSCSVSGAGPCCCPGLAVPWNTPNSSKSSAGAASSSSSCTTRNVFSESANPCSRPSTMTSVAASASASISSSVKGLPLSELANAVAKPMIASSRLLLPASFNSLATVRRCTLL